MLRIIQIENPRLIPDLVESLRDLFVEVDIP